MESTTPFDLNQAIQRWREGLAQSPALLRENLDELESHLRDSITTLQARDLSAEEAFLVSTRRLGESGALVPEFAKVNDRALWLDRMLWMLIGVQVWSLSGFVGFLSNGALSLGLIGYGFDFKAHEALSVLGFILARLLAIAGTIALCWWMMGRKGQSVRAKIEPFLRRRTTLAVTCGLLCVIALAGAAVSYLWQILVVTLGGVQILIDMNPSMTYSHLFGLAIQTITIIIVTLLVARKRICRSAAPNL